MLGIEQLFNPLDVVTACYRALLDRDPDALALSNWMPDGSNELDIQALLKSIAQSEEFQQRQQPRKASPSELPLFNDQSQFGEFPLLVRRLVDAAVPCRLVVDVGANGRARSNSYDLMRSFGWRGLLIEANPARNPIIAEEFVGCHYDLLNYAVSDYAGEATFHLGINDDVSSLVPETAAAWGAIQGELTVKVERLPTLLQQHAVPIEFGVLSIDAEGEDVRILNDTVGSGYRPGWIIIEASDDFAITSLDQLPLTEVVRAAYRIVDRTRANLILERR